LTQEQIKAKYGDELKPEIEGKLYDVLSSLFIHLVGIKRIIMPGEFKSSRDTKAIKCTVRAAEGYIYPMKSSIVFIHKPVMYIKHADIKSVEFSRVGHGAAGLSRSFDITLTRVKEDTNVTFQGIDKEEEDCLKTYFKSSGIRTRTVDLETHALIDSDSDEGGAVQDRGAGKRKIKAKDVNDID
jgi:structure-specific recognition protein 1